MTKNREKSEQTRQTLLKAALLTFYNQGVVKATVKDIVKEANVTRGAFYWHFQNKEELLEELSNIYISNTERIIARALDEKKVWPAFENSIQEFFHCIQHDECQRQFSCIMFQEFGQKDSTSILRPVHDTYHAMWEKHMHAALKQGKERGELPEDLDIGWAFIQLSATLIGLVKLLLGPFPHENAQRYAATTITSTMTFIASAPVQNEKTQLSQL